MLDPSHLLNAVQLYMLQRDMIVRFFLDHMRQHDPPWSLDQWEEWLSDEPFGIPLPRELQERILREWSTTGGAVGLLRHQA